MALGTAGEQTKLIQYVLSLTFGSHDPTRKEQKLSWTP
jgi:hypothetical protein